MPPGSALWTIKALELEQSYGIFRVFPFRSVLIDLL